MSNVSLPHATHWIHHAWKWEIHHHSIFNLKLETLNNVSIPLGWQNISLFCIVFYSHGWVSIEQITNNSWTHQSIFLCSRRKNTSLISKLGVWCSLSFSPQSLSTPNSTDNSDDEKRWVRKVDEWWAAQYFAPHRRLICSTCSLHSPPNQPPITSHSQPDSTNLIESIV